MRAVLDTNVVVSALVWGGVPERVLQIATYGDLLLCSSPVLIAELHDVLTRSHLAAQLQRRRRTIEEAISLYASLVVTVTPGPAARVVPGDPDDDHVVAAALAAHADMIVSGDRHLLGMGSYKGISIVAPAEAVRIIAG